MLSEMVAIDDDIGQLDDIKVTRSKSNPLLFTTQIFEVNSGYSRFRHGSYKIGKIYRSIEKVPKSNRWYLNENPVE